MRTTKQYVQHRPSQGACYRIVKRGFDIVAACLACVIFTPMAGIVALFIKLDSAGPVLFKQLRLGKGGVPFTIYKFRTMIDRAIEIRNSDGSKFVGEDDPRLTRVGRVLRDFSLDELPQLINVVRGDMSLVGPRPDTPDGPDMEAEVLVKKRLVRPGLTSLASIRGRNAIEWRQRVLLETEYVDTASLALDAYILLKTVPVVLLRQGIYTRKS